MFNRPVLFLAILAASAGIPYALNHPQLGKSLREQWTHWTSSGATPSALSNFSAAGGGNAATTTTDNSDWWSWLSASSAPPQEILPPVAPVFDFQEIFRLDVQPEHILHRWPRVTTTLAENDLQGLRVPLVTGPNVDDLTGSLTYYFDKQRVCQRLSFQGTTGDPRRLVMLTTMLYELQAVPSLNAGLFVKVKSNKPESLLQIDYAPVVKATNPHQTAALMLELNRPQSPYGLSAESQQRLSFHQHTNRW